MKKLMYVLLAMLMLFSTSWTALANPSYYQVVGNSMNPELQDGDRIEVVSEQFADGDMVVAMKKDGTKIVKRLMGERLVSVGEGTSYSIDEVTILGAAKYAPMSLVELEEYGFQWETVLGEGVTIVEVAAGDSHSLARTNTGEVYAWGKNDSGQLGDETTTNRHTPVRVIDGEMGNSGITAISAGYHHSLAIKNGKVYAWGKNEYGQLGDGTTTDHHTPVRVFDEEIGNSGITAISAGYSHSLALKNGEVYAWGRNDYGQLGDGTTTNRHSPVKVEGGVMDNFEVTAISIGSYHSLAIKDEKVYAWGRNDNGQLGDGTTTNRHTPVEVSAGEMVNSEVTAISAGGRRSLALKNGEVYAWGYNNEGQLGDGTKKSSNTPVKVEAGEMGNSEVTAISAGAEHSLALKNGEVYAWGNNVYGRLGDGTVGSRTTPVKVSEGEMGNSDITMISAGSFHSLAIKNGKVYAWGSSSNGQLGNGTYIPYRVIPVKVSEIVDAKTPTITTQPLGATALKDAPSPMLEVEASVHDGGILSYQWYSNTTESTVGGTAISGANHASYEVPTDTVGTVYYYVVVTNTNTAINGNPTAMITSDVVAVMVNELVNAEVPTITTQPLGASVNRGSASPMLEVEASVNDGGTLSYQWYRNTSNSTVGGVAITGADSTSYEVPTDIAGTAYYYVVVTNMNAGVSGNPTANITSDVVAVTVNELVNAEAPTITNQPLGASVNRGSASPILEVEASVNDGGTLSYQWYRNTTNSPVGGTAITGADSASYEVPTDIAGTTYYYVVVTNMNAGVSGNPTANITSDVVAVTVNDIENNLENAETPTITKQPLGASVNRGSASPMLEVEASVNDGGTLSYQWYRNTTNSPVDGTAITGADSASYEVPTDTVGTAYYYVIVTNMNAGVSGNPTATTLSEVVSVTVNDLENDLEKDLEHAEAPTITTQPFGATVLKGSPSPTLEVEAIVGDGGTLSYQWYRNTTNSPVGGTAITGADSACYEVPTDTVGTMYYYVVVTNTNVGVSGNPTSTTTSDVVSVTVNDLENDIENAEIPTITKQPLGASVNRGSASPTLEVEAIVSDGGTLSYQWYRNTTNSPIGGMAIDGADSTSYEVPTDTVGTMYYYVVVTNTNVGVSGNPTATTTSDVVAVTVHSTNSGGGGSSGGGTFTPTNSFAINPFVGRKISFHNVEITFPVGAFSRNFTVVIDKVHHLKAEWQPKNREIISDVFEITKDYKGNFDHPITISISFNLENMDSSKYDIAIYRLNKETGQWIQLDNLTVDWAQAKVSAEVNDVTTFALLATEKPAVELPHAPESWAEDSMSKLVQLGAIIGYPDGTFKPNNPITRAEFTAIVVRVLKLELSGGKTFSDTNNYWAQDEIATAYEYGIINGYNESTFGVNDYITREQMAVMIVNAFELQQGDGKTFLDQEHISTWAEDAIRKASSNGIITGYEDGMFKPKNHATRAEAVTVIMRALEIDK